MVNKDEKIEKLIKDDLVFGVSETNKYSYFICRGETNANYDIVYFKELDRWKCNCNNVRLTNCYHIKACQRLNEIENSENDNSDIDNNSIYTYDSA